MQDVILYNGSPALLVNGLSGECQVLLDGQPRLLHSFTVLFKTLWLSRGLLHNLDRHGSLCHHCKDSLCQLGNFAYGAFQKRCLLLNGQPRLLYFKSESFLRPPDNMRLVT